MTDTSLTTLGPTYQQLWDGYRPGVPAPGAPPRSIVSETDSSINLILSGSHRYRALEATTGVPWWFMGIVHLMESSCDFRRHIHNGDPLTARTVQVPAGRPAAGDPPFTWEASATDAFELHGWLLDKVHRLPDGGPDWSIPTVLWRLEAWNGFGYRNREVRSPYLWAGSNREQPGRYVRDGVWDGNAWSKQIGAAVILKAMVARGLVRFGPVAVAPVAAPAPVAPPSPTLPTPPAPEAPAQSWVEVLVAFIRALFRNPK